MQDDIACSFSTIFVIMHIIALTNTFVATIKELSRTCENHDMVENAMCMMTRTVEKLHAI